MGFQTEFQFTNQTYTPTSIDFGKLRADNGKILTNWKYMSITVISLQQKSITSMIIMQGRFIKILRVRDG